MAQLLELPAELVLLIIGYFSSKDKTIVRCVCKFLKQLIDPYLLGILHVSDFENDQIAAREFLQHDAICASISTMVITAAGFHTYPTRSFDHYASTVYSMFIREPEKNAYKKWREMANELRKNIESKALEKLKKRCGSKVEESTEGSN